MARPHWFICAHCLLFLPGLSVYRLLLVYVAASCADQDDDEAPLSQDSRDSAAQNIGRGKRGDDASADSGDALSQQENRPLAQSGVVIMQPPSKAPLGDASLPPLPSLLPLAR